MKRLHPGTPLLALAAMVVAACGGGGGEDASSAAAQGNIKTALAIKDVNGCKGPDDQPETALQGQVPAALRQAGFKGFNCNLELIAQSKGDGANWQTTQFRNTHGNPDNQGRGTARKGASRT